MKLHDLDKPPREPRDAIQDALDKGTVYLVWLDTSEVRAVFSRDAVIADIAAGEYCDPLKVTWLCHQQYSDQSESIARAVLDKLIDETHDLPESRLGLTWGPRPAAEFIMAHVPDWGDVIFEATQDARSEAEHIRIERAIARA